LTQTGGTNLWLFLEMLARRRGLLLAIVMVVTLGAVALAFLLPSWYTAEVVLLPPKDMNVSSSGAFSTLSGVASLTEGLTLPMMVTPSDVYARILRSRRISEAIIERFNLQERYETSTMTATLLALSDHVTMQVQDEGLLTVRVEDKSPDTAALIANAYIEELRELNRDIVAQRAKQTRTFVSQRLEQVAEELAAARQALEDFQRKHRTIDFDEQTRLAIEQAVDLKIALAQVELDLAMRSQVLQEDNPELVEKRRRRDIIRGQLQTLETGGDDTSYFSVPVAAIPSLRGEFEDLYSRVQVNERLYTILLEQNEQVRISAQEEMPTFSVLDYARAPEVRSRPQRTRLVVSAFVLAVLVGIVLAAAVEYVGRLAVARPEDYQRLTSFFGAYFGWLPGVKRRAAQSK